eukprot:973983-Pelagomonas_calceolata.AAC.4
MQQSDKIRLAGDCCRLAQAKLFNLSKAAALQIARPIQMLHARRRALDKSVGPGVENPRRNSFIEVQQGSFAVEEGHGHDHGPGHTKQAVVWRSTEHAVAQGRIQLHRGAVKARRSTQ